MNPNDQAVPRYPIRVVSRLTGIGIDTLRAWERRYAAVTPGRDERGRLYSEADVARLRVLHEAVSAGHRVGRIASLGIDELRRLTAAPAVEPTARPAAAGAVDLSRLKAALRTFDGVALDQELSRLAAALSPIELARDVALPVAREVGEQWNRQQGGIAHEHLVSSTLRHLLGSVLRVYARGSLPVRLLFATTSGDRHELGILAAAMLAASHGLAVTYVGPDLPAGEILAAVRSADARVLVLGLTLSEDGRGREDEVAAIARGLLPGVELWAGGPAIGRYVAALGRRGLALADLDAYVGQLDRLIADQRAS